MAAADNATRTTTRDYPNAKLQIANCNAFRIIIDILIVGGCSFTTRKAKKKESQAHKST